MKKYQLLLLNLITILIVLMFPQHTAHAVVDCPFSTNPTPPIPVSTTIFSLHFDTSSISQDVGQQPLGGTLRWTFPGSTYCGNKIINTIKKLTDIPSGVDYPVDTTSFDPSAAFCYRELGAPASHDVGLIYEYVRTAGSNSETVQVPICSTKSYEVFGSSASCHVVVSPPVGGISTLFTITITGIDYSNTGMGYLDFYVELDGARILQNTYQKGNPDPTTTASNLGVGDHFISVKDRFSVYNVDTEICNGSIHVLGPNITPTTAPPTPTFIPTVVPGQPTYTPVPPTSPTPPIILQDLCDNIANPKINPDENAKCHACIDMSKTPYKPLKPVADKPQRIWTAIGCVPTDVPTILSQYVLGATGLGIAGGVGFLYFLYGAFLVLTSMGNAEKINEGKEIMMSSIWGILLIIFSIFLLKVVAVQVLRIPGFT